MNKIYWLRNGKVIGIYFMKIRKKISINRERFKLHTWIGVAYLSLWLFGDLISSPANEFPKRIINNFWLCSYLVVLNFILYEYIVPFIKITWKRLLVAPFLLFAHSLMYSFGIYAWRHILIQLHLYFPFVEHASAIDGAEYDFRKLKETAQQLRIEKQEAELNYLKSQTNPHFLFNTLNNIYSLSRDKSDLAPESIMRLSKILRYMLYETGGDFIAIEQELKIIGDYIELEKLRYDDSLRINFNYNIEDMKQALPPLLLIPLVENAFKHGVSETRNQPFVDIHLSVNNRQLSFFVKNSTDKFSREKTVKENIGLSNLRRQLQLLYTDFDLSVQMDDAVFTAILKINLANHV